MKTKLLFIIGGLGVGGKERQLIEIINNLPQDQFEIQLVIKEKNGYYFDLIDKNKCIVHNVGWKGYGLFNNLQSIKYIRTLIKVVNLFKPDFVISFSIEMTYLYVVGRILTIQRSKLINMTIRDAPLNFNPFLKFKRFTYKYFKYVVANSDAGLKSYKQENLKNRYVLYNGLNENRLPKIDKMEARRKLNFDRNDFIVTFVGKQDKRKDHLCFIMAAEIVIKKYPNIKFIIVGDGTESSKNKDFAKQLGLVKNIIFTGMCNQVELYLQLADINVLCSSSWHGEGIPNTVLESFACGTPVIATDNGGTKEIVDHRVNGYLIKCSDFETLSFLIEKYYLNKNLLLQYSANAYAKYRNKFANESMIKNFIEIIGSIN